MKYVIHLNSASVFDQKNAYGYWTGKQYIVQGSYYPVCADTIDNTVKRYSNKIRAKKSAQIALERFGYVTEAEVCEEGE